MDVTKIRVGDKVKFRDGSIETVTESRPCSKDSVFADSHPWWIEARRYGGYSPEGRYRPDVKREDPVDIVEHYPASEISRKRHVFDAIRQWADDRNLILGSNPKAHMLKLMEEMGELANAIGKSNMPEMRDAIGDCVVVLTILAAQHATQIEDCILGAYDEIKDRKGRMVDGMFVKEEV